MAVNSFSRQLIEGVTDATPDKNQLYDFPPTRGDGKMDLADLIGQTEVNNILTSKSIEFLAAGDTGLGDHTEQSTVVDTMSEEFIPTNPGNGATFFMHLGDIIYGPQKQSNYAGKFYRPNMSWLKPAPGIAGLILGIPGNHDGEVRDPDDKPSLGAFLENFCTQNPEMAASFNVTMPNQPGPYWWLSAPFLDVIGLYSNAAEDSGTLGIDDADTKQQKWLEDTLKKIAAERQSGRKALVFATHHTPYNRGLSATGKGHPGSPDMLLQIDAACRNADVWPDMFISGHSHNYQRYMRSKVVDGRTRTIPYLIGGAGGHGSEPVATNFGNKSNDVTYEAGLGATDQADVYGYLRIRASTSVIQSTFVRVIGSQRQQFDTVAIDLSTGARTAPEF